MSKLSPMMTQYMKLKEQHQDCMLFFRLGDFYELFFDDAILASKELDLTLTGRDCGLKERAPMCGVPYHAVNIYIKKLIKKGYKVAICEQTTLPEKGVKLVEREVIRIVTPGTIIEEDLLNESENNYIMSLVYENGEIGFAYADVSTGHFYIGTSLKDNLLTGLTDELSRLNPAEIIINDDFNDFLNEYPVLAKQYSFSIDAAIKEYYSAEYSGALVRKHFQGNETMLESVESSSMAASGALIKYLSNTQKNALLQLNKVSIYKPSKFMKIDTFTRNSLELTKTIRDSRKKGSLLWVIDKTSTSLGSRKIRQWLEQPLLDKDQIENRLSAVEYLKKDPMLMENIKEQLKYIKDIQRLSTKIAYASINPRECLMLKTSLQVLPELKKLIDRSKTSLLNECFDNIDTLNDVYDLLDASIQDNPPTAIKDGGVIKSTYNEVLSELLDIMENGQGIIENIEKAEREQTGIKTLKIKYNRVFGYFIEVTRSNLDLVPYRYIRKQTLANNERYITEELKELEDKILGAKEKSVSLEQDIFSDIKNALKTQIRRLQKSAEYISIVDTLVSLATVANENGYCKPEINTDGIIDIKSGRHPVVEAASNINSFVPNNSYLDMAADRFIIITGPNMSGKSTYLRQVALINILAQIGSFVPAISASLPITDRVFSRVGASDDLFLGQSTFMVEMTEVAHILKNATENSLIILDEIGRGTSTFDGLSIAWSVTEYICDRKKIGAKALFATHYHQLSELEGKIEGLKNYSVAVKEYKNEIIFMRKIIKGGSDKSFGLHVAMLAGIPQLVIERGESILKQLEAADINNVSIYNNTFNEILEGDKPETKEKKDRIEVLNKLAEEIKEVDLTVTTPIEAFMLLKKYKDKLG
ncbi:MAG: DNA mismatch repair protein MutS [Clostridia bacterium]|nr:DNA mismatch repair protein MutS [Clostridia bacterium]